MNNTQCSELFNEVFRSGWSGRIRVCDCGITYFDGYNDCDWEDGELEKLRQKARDKPKLYVEVDCSVSTIEIGPSQLVIDCTCGQAKRYEDFILNHAHQLAKYLNKTAVLLREESALIEVKNETNKIP